MATAAEGYQDPVNRLLPEPILLAGITRATGMSERWLQGQANATSAILGDHPMAVYRQYTKVYTDFWEAYVTVIPSKQHEAVGKDSGLTRYIERLNNTLRQRVARLERKTLSFSKKLENPIGAIWLFSHDYNRQVREKLAKQGYPAFSSVLH